jgi:hypothetical protein
MPYTETNTNFAFSPQATLQGFRACYGFNSNQGCSRVMKDAMKCSDGSANGAVYIHCCSYWDPASKRHCLSTSHNKFTGGH